MLTPAGTFWVQTFWVQKRGGSPQEYEDAFWVGAAGNSDGEIQGQSLTVAVADGASESLLAGRWANRLVGVFGTVRSATRTRASFIAAYQKAVSGWDQELLRYTTEREERRAPIQWYEEPGLAKGAYSTILAVHFRDGQEGRPSTWRAVGLGDTCLFQVRNESLYASFPMSDASEFSYQPPLLASRGSDVEKLRRHVKLKTNDWEHGDIFYLATDALSAWFLRSNESGQRPWGPLRDMDTSDARMGFAEWVDEQRDIGQMHNDDTTLIRIDT
jgi:hypothetical protein